MVVDVWSSEWRGVDGVQQQEDAGYHLIWPLWRNAYRGTSSTNGDKSLTGTLLARILVSNDEAVVMSRCARVAFEIKERDWTVGG